MTDKKLKEKFISEIEQIIDIIHTHDLTNGLIALEFVDILELFYDVWTSPTRKFSKKKIEKSKVEILAGIISLKRCLSSPLHFRSSANEDFIQIIKDPSRKDYNYACNEIRKQCTLILSKYIEFKEYNGQYEYNEEEELIIKEINSAIKLIENNPFKLMKTEETDFSDELRNLLESSLKHYNIVIERERPGGFANVKQGEIDLFISNYKNDIKNVIAVGEVKKWGKYKIQLKQLLGYMIYGSNFGFTIILNKDTSLSSLKEKMNKIIEELEVEHKGEAKFKTKHFVDLEDFNNTYVSSHVNPDNDKEFRIYHIIVNVNKEAHLEAAKQARA